MKEKGNFNFVCSDCLPLQTSRQVSKTAPLVPRFSRIPFSMLCKGMDEDIALQGPYDAKLKVEDSDEEPVYVCLEQNLNT